MTSVILRSKQCLAYLCSVLLFFVGVALGGDASAQTSSKIEIKTITLGLVSEINRSAIEDHFREFVRYVARRLSSGSAVEGKVVVAPTPFELAKLLEQRRVDFFMESAYPSYTVNYVHNAGRTVLRRWKSGKAEYYSLIFTKRDGTIKRLEDLRGKTMVFEDPGSSSGYLLPKLYLQRRGFKLAEKKEYDPNATAGAINYVFALSQNKLFDWVVSKQAAAGAFSDDDYSNLSDRERSDIEVLAQTERLPRHLVSVRADLARAVAARLEEILLAMSEDEEGRRILSKTDGTTKFDRLPGGEAGLRKMLLDSFYSPDRK